MLNKILIFSATAALLIPNAGADEGTERSRIYKPLEAKKVSIRTAARVDPATQEAAATIALRKQGWRHFDLREWDEAANAFLSTLEKNPEDVQAAEGLAMSVYHSGDYSSAFRLGEELKGVMPSVGRLVSETVLAEVRYMVKKEEFAAASEFLTHFPGSDGALAEARQIVGNASTLTIAIGPDDKVTQKPDPTKKLVKN